MSGEPKEKRAKMPLKLGYWKIRGLAQPIRLLLKYTGTDFEDIRYEQGDGPEFSREVWLSVKNTLGLEFPNLPYLMDGDLKITQSNAILRYIARKHNLSGSTEAERVLVNMLECEAMDFRNGFVRVCYNPAMASMRDDYIKNVRQKIKRFSDCLGEKQWFAGDQVTYVDFVLYELLDQHWLFEPTLLDDSVNLKTFLDRFEALQAIKDYIKSAEYIQRPVNNKNAQWY